MDAKVGTHRTGVENAMGHFGMGTRLYKWERILMQQVDLKSALNSKDFFLNSLFINSLFKSANTVLGN